MIGYNTNDIDTLKQSLRGLVETVAEWDMLDEKGRQEWGVSSLLSYAKLKGGICEYAYSPGAGRKAARSEGLCADQPEHPAALHIGSCAGALRKLLSLRADRLDRLVGS